jgi:hypothetical protein
MAGRATQWNPKYLLDCVQMCVGLLKKCGATGPALDLIREAAEHLDCVEKYDCKFYRSQLKQREAKLRRVQKVQPWEYWLLKAGAQILQPVPGTKNQAVIMLRCAVNEFDSSLGGSDVDLSATWSKWYEQHVKDVPAYVEPDR